MIRSAKKASVLTEIEEIQTEDREWRNNMRQQLVYTAVKGLMKYKELNLQWVISA